jgi:formylmethanofuran:tetrahydromethanopterin formyltransferase
MENFLKRIEEDLDNKILSCMNGETIVKPFNKVYEQVREKKSKDSSIKTIDRRTLIYSEGEESIYKQVIAKFLKENPEFLIEEERQA